MENSRIFILQVLDVLKECSDENHYLTQADIILKLKGINVDCDRRAVSRAISELSDYGYDIASLPHKGYALFTRPFDKSEAEYMIHAVYSSKAISSKAAKGLVDKIEQGFSKYDRMDFSYLYKSGEISRTENPQVFLTTGLIEEAIQKNKKVSFEYISIDSDLVEKPKKGGQRYVVSPYYLFVNNGSYFLIGNTFPHKGMTVYRISKIKEAMIENEALISLKEIDKDFKIEEYLNDHVYPFFDKPIITKLSFAWPGLVNQIKGWFGENASFEKTENGYIASIRNGEDCLYYWLTHYADGVKVISPEGLRERIKDYGKKIEEMYLN